MALNEQKLVQKIKDLQSTLRIAKNYISELKQENKDLRSDVMKLREYIKSDLSRRNNNANDGAMSPGSGKQGKN